MCFCKNWIITSIQGRLYPAEQSQTKYGKICKNKPWRKLHLAIDVEMNMHSVEITDYEASDIGEMSNLIPDEHSYIKIKSVTADGAYYSKEGVEQLHERGITPVIPPPSHAVVHGADDTKWHDKIVQYIKDKGTVYAFHKKYGYGKRALVEAQILLTAVVFRDPKPQLFFSKYSQHMNNVTPKTIFCSHIIFLNWIQLIQSQLVNFFWFKCFDYPRKFTLIIRIYWK